MGIESVQTDSLSVHCTEEAMTNMVGKMFKDDIEALEAEYCEAMLEKTIRSGMRLTRRKWLWIELVPQALENRAVPIIKNMLHVVNPELYKNVRKMDERVIWMVYWCLRSNPANKKMFFLELLAELDKNPPFASIFA
jgi:hypothetical protein